MQLIRRLFYSTLWNIDDGVCEQILSGHANTVSSVLQLKGGRTVYAVHLMTASLGYSVRHNVANSVC